MSDPVLLRGMVPGDLPYVFSTWLRDLRDADPSGLPDDLWFPPHRSYIERTLADRDNVALVACAADAPTEILGYVVARPAEVLEWIHVRKPLRQKGLAKRLLTAVNSPLTEPMPARWMTRDAKNRLRVVLRSRELRRTASSRPRSTAGASPSSTP